MVSILLGSEAERKEEAEADKLPLVGLCLDRMQQALSQAISQAKDLEIWLHEKTNGRNFPSKGTDAWGVCLLQNSWDIAEAIIICWSASFLDRLGRLRDLFAKVSFGVSGYCTAPLMNKSRTSAMESVRRFQNY